MDITMPQLGEAVDEGTITAWLKQVGDEVTAEEPLFEVSTDKVDTEVPAPASGVIESILVDEGETAEVGTKLAVLRTEGAPTAAEPSTAEDGLPADSGDRQSSDQAENRPATQDGSGSDTPDRAPHSRGFVLSPLVRKLLKEHGVAPDQVEPSGGHGRITRDDVLRFVAQRTEVAAPPTTAEQPADEPPVAVPFSRMRRSIADHMVQSKATSPHAYTSIEVDFEAIEQLRRRRNDEWRQREGSNLTYLPFVCRALCDALAMWPRFNATIEDNALALGDGVNLGVAVDLEHEGLVAPVVRNAEQLRLPPLARKVRQLANRARNRDLSPDDMAGATFTVTNMGPFGTHQTLPIINQPQVAILATDAIQARPVAVATHGGEHAIAIRHMGYLSVAWDHRAVDGAYAGSFLASLKKVLETQDWEAELR